MRQTLPVFLFSAVSAVSLGCNAGQDADPGAPTPAALTARSGRAIALAGTHGPATLGDPLPEAAGAHVAISLRRQNEAAHEALLADLQNPASPRFHAWLTPSDYGERFGLSADAYDRVVAWLEGAGLAVHRYPNRLFVDAAGTVAQVRALLGVQLRSATLSGKAFRSYAEQPVLPADIAPLVLKLGGLDTRAHFHHHLRVQEPEPGPEGGVQEHTVLALGGDDLRTLYDVPSIDGGGASGLTVAVLAWQGATFPPHVSFVPPDEPAIDYYLANVSHARATYNPIVLPNPDDAFGTVGDNVEWALDVEMQSVGASSATQIDLVLAPSSLLAETGAQYIVNELSGAVVVSTSFGACEHAFVVADDGGVSNPASEAYVFRMAVQQGIAEGQTWFAASGDDGAVDCDGEGGGPLDAGFGGGSATVDLPCSLPEVVCVGGTMFGGPGTWTDAGALTGYVQEVTWHEGSDPNAGAGAGGGGQSALFAKPAYQTGVGPDPSDGARDLPDLSLMAAGFTPGVIFDDGAYGFPIDGGPSTLSLIGGTSASAPLAAGLFAHLSGDVGCRLGDIHGTLYALGAAQHAHPGPNAPFHDITGGNNDYQDFAGDMITGFGAQAGYDLATGWGSVDFANLVAAWPACASTDGGTPGDAGHDGAPRGDAGDKDASHGDAGPRDAARESDAGVHDAGLEDAARDGAKDASHGADAGPRDAARGNPDTGARLSDSGRDAFVARRDAGVIRVVAETGVPPRDAASVGDARTDAADEGEPATSGGCSESGAARAPLSLDWAMFLGFSAMALVAPRRKRR